MKLMKTIVFLALLAGTGLAQADTTSAQEIGLVKVDGDDGKLYLQSVSKDWNASGCSDALWVYFRPDEVYDIDLLTMAVLAAKSAGVKTYFKGRCDSDLHYLRATEMYVR